MTSRRFQLQATALAALLCATGAAQAKTWVLSSDKQGLSSYDTGVSIVNAIYSTFETASGGATETIDGRGLLHASATEALPADVPADVDIVVVASVQPNQVQAGTQHGVDATRFAKVMDWAQTRSDLTFVFLNDGCCRASDTGSVAGFLNASLGLSGPDEITRVGSVAPQGGSVYLNTNSPYKDNFAALDPLAVEVYGKYVNVPAPYAVYLAPAAADTPPASMPAAADKVQAYGVVIPRAATNGSACVIAFSDTSQFALASAPAQAGQLASGIMAAAKDSAGACQVKTVATADLAPSMTLSSPLQVGGNGTLTVKVDNHGLSASAGGSITVILPPGVEVEPAHLPAGCTKPGALQVDCTLSPVNAQASQDFALPFKISAPGQNVVFRAQIAGGSAQTGELAPQLQNNGPIESKVTIAAPTATISGPATAQPGTATTITGTATGLADGAQVTVTVNGAALQATVTGGNFSVSFPSGFPAGTHAVTVTGPNSWALTQTAPHNIKVEAPAQATTATISGPATAQPGVATTITGTSNAADGTVIQVTVNGVTVPATVSGGKFSAHFPNGFPAGTHAVSIAGATLTAPHSIDVKALPATATISGPANAIAHEATTVTGTTAQVPDGTVINVTVNGTTVQATVNGGQFSASFPNGFPVGQHPVTITGPGGQNLPLTAPYSIHVTAPTPPGNAAPVPALNVWSLGALAALLGAAGLRRQRKRS
ncbi:MAG: IPTL-CTERM sorting domain-containing protein [Comamonadaceae bacterium]|nr:IPTL-CTERM sorting domain-containing protein [Comamonadaceae bacterium]